MPTTKKIYCPFCGKPLTDINDLMESEVLALFGEILMGLPESRYFYCANCNEFYVASDVGLWKTTKERIMLDTKTTGGEDILPADLMSDEEKEEYLRRLEEETLQFHLELLESQEREARRRTKEVGGISHRCLKCGKLLQYVVEFQRGVCVDCMRKMGLSPK